jgi:hypothetical protein
MSLPVCVRWRGAQGRRLAIASAVAATAPVAAALAGRLAAGCKEHFKQGSRQKGSSHPPGMVGIIGIMGAIGATGALSVGFTLSIS